MRLSLKSITPHFNTITILAMSILWMRDDFPLILHADLLLL